MSESIMDQYLTNLAMLCKQIEYNNLCLYNGFENLMRQGKLENLYWLQNQDDVIFSFSIFIMPKISATCLDIQIVFDINHKREMIIRIVDSFFNIERVQDQFFFDQKSQRTLNSDRYNEVLQQITFYDRICKFIDILKTSLPTLYPQIFTNMDPNNNVILHYVQTYYFPYDAFINLQSTPDHGISGNILLGYAHLPHNDTISFWDQNDNPLIESNEDQDMEIEYTPVLIKVINALTDDDHRKLQREIGYLSTFNCEYLVKLYGITFTHDNKMGLVMEYAPYNSIYKYLTKLNNKLNEALRQNNELNEEQIKEYQLNEEQRQKIIFCVIQGLRYLHSRKIMHRDIKPQNIVLFPDFTAKIIDFGYVRAKTTEELQVSRCGTAFYCSPEAYAGNTCIESDIFSLGLTINYLYEMDLPIDLRNQGENVIIEYSNHVKRFYNKNLPKDIQILIRYCLQENAHDRPTAEELSIAWKQYMSGNTNWLNFLNRQH